MWTRRSLGIVLFAVVMLSPELRAADFNLTGHIIDDRTNGGISSLTVSLRPPANNEGQQRLTSTDAGGGFVLNKVPAGRYLLEVFQGVTPVYREVVELDRETAKEIRLHR